VTVGVPTAAGFLRGQQRSLQQDVLPAPIGGIDGRYNLASNRPENCVYAYNLVPEEFGLQTREGAREWATNCSVGGGLGVRTIVPYRSVSGVDEKLFAVTNEGIWDVTTSSTTPTRIHAFAIIDDTAGWGHYLNFTTDAGETKLFYTDSANGILEYDAILNNWSQPAITGPDLSRVAFIVNHKQRIWMVESASTDAWYLDIGAIAGPATKFAFGTKFKHGGELVGVYTWTLDSGAGVDDILVAISRSGDVLPYQGEDPSLAVSWGLIGTFYVGDVPVGRRVADEVGGDLHILSDLGLVAMSDLLKGATGFGQMSSLTSKITRFIRADMTDLRAFRGWEIRHYPNDAALLINTPLRAGGRYLQYRLNTTVEGWGFWRDVPGLTFEPWDGHLMVGTADNRVLRMDSTRDGGTVADPAGGDPIEFSLLHNFFNLGTPALFKWGETTRPDWISIQEPSYNTQFLYDYRFGEIRCSAPVSQAQAALWDEAIWDVDIWGSSSLTGFNGSRGSWGTGRTLSVALCGSCVERTTLVSTDIMWRTGQRGF
jgi:hypothetical protein